MHLTHDIDWVAALILSTCLALLSFELAVAMGKIAGRYMCEPMNIAFLCIAVTLLPAFALWMRHQPRLSHPT